MSVQIYAVKIPLGYNQYSIVHLEMLNILLAVHTWASRWQVKSILIYCDNQAVVSVLSSGRTRDMTLAAMACNICMEAAKADINLKTLHILGKNNIVAITLSRWGQSGQQIKTFYTIMPNPKWVELPRTVSSLIGLYNFRGVTYPTAPGFQSCPKAASGFQTFNGPG